MNRYSQLIQIVESKQPKRILEVGTWNGRRAVEMLEVAPLAYYYGFDLFENATKETDEKEFNVKAHNTMDSVRGYLDQYYPGQYELYKGDTNETLRYFQEEIDFAFIDGGHSEETIRNDFQNVVRVMKQGTIVLDDFYKGVFKDGVGCNSLVLENGFDWEELSICDPVVGGGTVQMVKVEYVRTNE